jgi:hypothetical protein
MEFTADHSNSYRVEVSGWDASESFFVEKTMLDWGRDEKKEIRLHSVLREGSVVFVRLLQTLTSGNNFPVAYQAQRIGPRDPEGHSPVHLAQLRPRPLYKQSPERLADSARVA